MRNAYSRGRRKSSLVAAFGTGFVSHDLTTPEDGSPKTPLLQSTPPVNTLGLVNLPFAPYWTSSVPVNAHRVFSDEQYVQPGCGVGVGVGSESE